MNPDLMTVLSMRQKEMTYHQLALDSRSNVLVATSPLQSPLKTPLPHSPDSVRHLPLSLCLPTESYEQFGFTWHWIVETATHFALQRQTAHFANQYAQVLLRRRAASAPDAYVLGYHREDVRQIQRQLRLLGLVCVFMAAKIEEVHPPKAADLVAFLAERGDAKVAVEDLSRFEVNYVGELQWNLHPTTPYAWLLFMVAGGSADQRPLDTMGDFVNPARNPSGTKDLFVNAIRLVDIALLDYQAIEYWPSVLAGAALLLVDPALDFMFVAQFLQLDPNVLWECKSWLYAMAYGVCDQEAMSSQAKDRWVKVPAEERLFIQSQVVVPSHLARGLLRPENVMDLYGAGMTTPLGNPYGLETCPSPCSPSTNYAVVPPLPTCLCSGNYHTCGGDDTPGPHVYHFKYGWQGIDASLMGGPNYGMHQDTRMQYP
ncbi:hypothetical protein PsorP6_015686 [Peronosclerospora sorghi]|uniref:Uncharacterized protein n=1 Tax=Peronosclerospora sorghi TaxID=230839 RepID=A0ACC0WM16_9STRA|nr:hypothetical protein PsorP6_015686 [Peronosclerospora sorghi]